MPSFLFFSVLSFSFFPPDLFSSWEEDSTLLTPESLVFEVLPFFTAFFQSVTFSSKDRKPSSALSILNSNSLILDSALSLHFPEQWHSSSVILSFDVGFALLLSVIVSLSSVV